jgi:hypothetical protein
MGLAVDNSGSEQGKLDWLQQATRNILETIEPMGGRASLVRVSTNANVRRGLTNDFVTLDNDVEELFINRGWTALYDGIRMANDTIGEAYSESAPPPDLDTFCTNDRKIGVVVFTDAKENNSADEHLPEEVPPNYPYLGDGIDTTFDDLKELKVNNVPTPIYTVGLGHEVDHEALEELAAATGGRHHRVEDASDLPEVFQLIADYAFANVKVCTDLPEDLCGTFYIRIQYTWTRCDNGGCSGETVKGEQVYEVYVECPVEENGRVATVLLTFSKPNISNTGMEPQVAKQLAEQIVEWVRPDDAPNPKVLVVKDDNHHGEFAKDAEYIHTLLTNAEIDATLINEPRRGLRLSQTVGYDVVWLSNPGYPPDDRRTLTTLEEFSGGGGGYVLQGDDMTWFWCDKGFSMTPYTGLVHQANGTTFCHRRIDNNATLYRYKVTIDGTELPMTEALEGAQFYYGDDIDTSYLADQGEQQVASAIGRDPNAVDPYCDKEVPVIVIRDPNASEP